MIDPSLTERLAREMIGNPIIIAKEHQHILKKITNEGTERNFNFTYNNEIFDVTWTFNENNKLVEVIKEIEEFNKKFDMKRSSELIGVETSLDYKNLIGERYDAYQKLGIWKVMVLYSKPLGYHFEDVFCKDSGSWNDGNIIWEAVLNDAEYGKGTRTIKMLGGENGMLTIINDQGEGYIPKILSKQDIKKLGEKGKEDYERGMIVRGGGTIQYNLQERVLVGFKKSDLEFKTMIYHPLPEKKSEIWKIEGYSWLFNKNMNSRVNM